MVDMHAQIMRSQRNEVSATVITARAMSPQEVAQLSEIIGMYFVDGGAKTKVLLEQKVDPDMLGGLQLTVGSTFVDFSLRTQIDDIEEA
jgi:F-type H+-transporting ATPase subunit delta